MAVGGRPLFTTAARSDWLRLRTLVLLRWLAVAGQGTAVAVSALWLGLDLPVDLCAAVIAASVGVNIVSTAVYPVNTRLSERNAALVLLFDLGQLGILLLLSGGLTNPFAVLVLAPVTVAATALTLRATLVLGLAALAMISALALVHVPLRFAGGEEIRLPMLHLGGTWAALTIGIVFLALYARRVAVESFSMSQALAATQMALAREQRLAAVGGLAAAAAHELGTPLATIKLVASELARELRDRPELAEDVALIRTQADRCRDILHALGRSGKEDGHLRAAPVTAVIAEAAEPHMMRGKRFILRVGGEPAGAARPDQPDLPRDPEIVHGLRNLVQNAVDFAHRHVWVDVDWDEKSLRIAVGDDGQGYPPDVLGRLGDPFVRHRPGAPPAEGDADRPDHEGMGLGLFIAKTLLERTGARIAFANGSESPPGAPRPDAGEPGTARPPGAIVEVVWPRAALGAGQRGTAPRARSRSARGGALTSR